MFHGIDKKYYSIYSINKIFFAVGHMKLEDIKNKKYSFLIKELPEIVSFFSTYSYLSKGRWHSWNRMHNQRKIKIALMPNDIETYISTEIKDLNKFLESGINIAFLIINNWYVSHDPFEKAIFELINEYIVKFKDKVEKRTIILIDNLMRKANRKFDTFFANDLLWLLGIYYNSIIRDSKLITYRNKNMESHFPQSDLFPIKNFSKKIVEIENNDKKIDIYKEIIKHLNNDVIIHITKTLGNFDGYYNSLENIVNRNIKEKKPIVIIWELKPCYKIVPENYSIKFLQGFTAENFEIIESILNYN